MVYGYIIRQSQLIDLMYEFDMLQTRNKDSVYDFDMRKSWHTDFVHEICMPRSHKYIIVTNQNIILASLGNAYEPSL